MSSCKKCNNASKEKKDGNEIIVEKLQMKLDMAEKEKEIFKKMEKEKSDLLSNFMNNANTIINKAHDNTKITAQAIQSVSMSALKYANEKYKKAAKIFIKAAKLELKTNYIREWQLASAYLYAGLAYGYIKENKKLSLFKPISLKMMAHSLTL